MSTFGPAECPTMMFARIFSSRASEQVRCVWFSGLCRSQLGFRPGIGSSADHLQARCTKFVLEVCALYSAAGKHDFFFLNRDTQDGEGSCTHSPLGASKHLHAGSKADESECSHVSLLEWPKFSPDRIFLTSAFALQVHRRQVSFHPAGTP